MVTIKAAVQLELYMPVTETIQTVHARGVLFARPGDRPGETLWYIPGYTTHDWAGNDMYWRLRPEHHWAIEDALFDAARIEYENTVAEKGSADDEYN